MARLRVKKTSKQAAVEKEWIKKDKDKKKKARFCPECGKRQFLKKRIFYHDIFGGKEFIGYSRRCFKCGCEWAHYFE